MRDNIPFDDFVKTQLSDYSPNVPEHIWKNIAAAKRGSKPKGFWISIFNRNNLLVLLAAILLIGGGASYFLFSSVNDNSSPKNIAGESYLDKKTNHISQKVTASSQENNKGDETTSPDDQSEEVKINVANNNIVQAPSENNSNQNNFIIPSLRNRALDNTNVNEDNTGEIDREKLSAINNKSVSNPIFFSPFTVNNAKELSVTKIINPLNIKLPDCPTIEKNAAGNKKYWEVYAGPDYAFKSYKSYSDTASANYLNKRKASTKFASAFSAGVRYTKVFNNATSIRTGINYSQVNEKFLYFNPNEIKYVTVITTRVIIRSPGDTVYINDTLQYQQTGARTKTTYNRYRNIDIPLVMGYEVGNEKIHANINAGVIINIYSWYKGDVLDSLYQPVSITTGKGNSVYQFKNNIGVGFLGSVSVYYKMTDNLHLLLEPYFRYNLSPMSKANLNLQQKNHTAGLRAGVRFDLK